MKGHKMSKQALVKLLRCITSESLEKATLGIIEGSIEAYQDGKMSNLELCEEVENVMAAYEIVRNEQRDMFILNEPQLSDE